MLDRRKILTIGGVAGAASVMPLARLAHGDSTENGVRNATSHHHHGGKVTTRSVAANAAPPLDPFSVPMPVPQVLRPSYRTSKLDQYVLDIQPANVEIFPGFKTAALTYGGTFVGPTILATEGRAIQIKYRNRLKEDANVHLHGGHNPASSDGHPMDVIPAGGSKVYTYPNRQPGATLWYHDHVHHLEAEHVFRGLHGFYLLKGYDEARLNLPSGEYDVPIMLRYGKFDEDGQILFSPYDDVSTRTTFLVNGRPQPYFKVAARRYRFRLLNASNHGDFKVNLGGREMVQIASDGGLLPAPVSRKEVLITPGERAEVVVDFSDVPVGSSVVLESEWGPVMRFDVDRRGFDTGGPPAVLRPNPTLPKPTVEREIRMQLSDDQQVFWINGKPFDPDRVDVRIKRGTTEVWRIYNDDSDWGIDHNFHLHMVRFRVLDRDGAPPWPGESGLKDTVSVPPGTSVRVQATFGEHLGRFVYHCHMMEHSGPFQMMAQMEIVQ
ncbi:multicopper oxidase family protein [Actinomadura livida]|uniref:FtsP/CotA-like multicopper oxidase with cupredoxin domain n=1 Tax=Actinomadura livida TaxID=79909 RepID=A0A7W7I8D0_9ACTN|nr:MULTISPECIES: multicopper oxidase family protein [Actinomadura]MBB4772391.1 FtsP/CotA-like multicopper oxidase with cupredoxin domain [Actinomadura catellatispora]GGU23265.1 multicopper oxidase [Actinomadura livida]